MKKLAVVVMMIAIATFMAAPMASANDHDWWDIHGKYAMIAAGACLHSTLGFETPPAGSVNTDLVPKFGSLVWGAPVMTQGIWTFEGDGTGVAALTNNILTLPPGNPPATPFGAGHTFFPEIHFTYEVTPDGEITVQLGPLPLNMAGMISMDHKTLTLGSAGQIQPVGGAYAICNVDRVLIRVSDE